jgi:hypothetical protein
MLSDFQTDSAFWYYYSWCQEMEALKEEQEQELEDSETLEDDDQ